MMIMLSYSMELAAVWDRMMLPSNLYFSVGKTNSYIKFLICPSKLMHMFFFSVIAAASRINSEEIIFPQEGAGFRIELNFHVNADDSLYTIPRS